MLGFPFSCSLYFFSRIWETFPFANTCECSNQVILLRSIKLLLLVEISLCSQVSSFNYKNEKVREKRAITKSCSYWQTWFNWWSQLHKQRQLMHARGARTRWARQQSWFGWTRSACYVWRGERLGPIRVRRIPTKFKDYERSLN